VEFQSENGILGMGPFPFEGEEDADFNQRRQADHYCTAGRELLLKRTELSV
jgi:acyl CoA:acetate/3-ketoacid CoA transferase beta subunit